MLVECNVCEVLKPVPEELVKVIEKIEVEIVEFTCAECKRTDEVGVA